MASPLKYAIVCCNEVLAFLDVSANGSVTVKPAAQTQHRTIAVAPVIDGKPVWTADEMFSMASA